MTEPQYNFKRFTQRRAHGETMPILSVQRRGNASLNKAAYEALGQPKSVDLFFDEGRKALALKPTHEESVESYPVRPVSSKASTYLISLTALLRYYNIPVQGAIGRYEGVEHDDMLIFDFSKAAEEG